MPEILTIDGPAASGKSTIAKRISEKLNITHLDSGAAYRAFTLHCLNNNVDFSKDLDVEKLFSSFHLDFVEGRVYLNSVDVSEEIRTSHISKNVRHIADNPAVRQRLTKHMQDLAGKKSVVMDGRDVANNILPNAQYKFFMIASLEVRTERRLKDLIKSGENISYEKLYENIKEREHIDYNRKVGALVKHKDAIDIDTSDLTIEEVVDTMIRYIK